mmetsp:Transcript_16261/g.18417  ORF Transcript_16261/g.18417 Transcript_16261/m.18417 type:complete len:230 (+) Transcript_16261:189-878(+)
MALRRIVGHSKPKVPTPTLEDTSKRMEGMGNSMDAKIAAQQAELKKIKIKLKGAKGATAASLKKRAMVILRRIKQYEKQRDQLANQQFNIDQQAFGMESMKATLETVQTMKETKKVMKKQMKKINIDKIEDLKDDIDELLEDNDEIQEILGNSYNMDDVSESELDAELEALDEFDIELDNEEAIDEVPDYLLDSNLPSSLPAAPADQFVPTASNAPEKKEEVKVATSFS